QRVTRAARNKRLADFPTEPGADRDVLQIRVLRIEPARSSRELIESRVDAAGSGKNRGGQRIGVSGLELRAFAIFDQSPHDFMFGRQSDEGLFVRGVLAVA